MISLSMSRNLTYLAPRVWSVIQYSMLLTIVHWLPPFRVRLADRCHLTSAEGALHPVSTERSIPFDDRISIRPNSLLRERLIGLSPKESCPHWLCKSKMFQLRFLRGFTVTSAVTPNSANCTETSLLA
jgi:hypothetical protein